MELSNWRSCSKFKAIIVTLLLLTLKGRDSNRPRAIVPES